MSFVVQVAGFSAELGTLVVVIGVPLLAGTLVAARFFADVERLRIPVCRAGGQHELRDTLDEALIQTHETLDEHRRVPCSPTYGAS